MVITLCLLVSAVSAQSGLTAHISIPDSSAFPQIQVYLDVKDANGAFMHNLQPDQVSVLEGDMTLPIDSLQEQRPGVQVVFALNPGPAFGIRNFQAVSRYDLVKDALRRWARGRLGTSTDDISLLITGGKGINHTPDHAKLIDSLDADQIDARNVEPSIDTLAHAVVLASDATPRAGMGKTVLFVTTAIDGNIEQAVNDITLQAQQQGIRIEIWMVASPGALVNQATQKLLAAAADTGGQVFNFGGDETLPSPETFLEARQSIYRVTYLSKVGFSGEHKLAIQVQEGEEKATSNEISFQVDLQPPEPAFISPPIVIERKLPVRSETVKKEAQIDASNTDTSLSPKEINLQVVFDFPDGRKRPIVSSALIVDGTTVAENKEPPFDQFVWNLDGYRASGSHQLQVQVTDELGLTGTSIQVPISVSVERPEADPWYVLRSNLLTISILLAVFGGVVLFLLLIIGGRLHPRTQKAASLQTHRQPASKMPTNPVEPVKNHPKSWASRFQHPQMQSLNALAFFQLVFPTEENEDRRTVPITENSVLIGSDPNQSNLVLDDPCIDSLHARLIHQEDGSFWLFDHGSIAGTWVNYVSVDLQGVKLENEDLVHFGRLGFRFTLRKPSHVLKPAVTLQQPETSQAAENRRQEGASDMLEKETEEPLL